MKTLKEMIGLSVAALVLGLGWNSFSESGISVTKKHLHDVPGAKEQPTTNTATKPVEHPNGSTSETPTTGKTDPNGTDGVDGVAQERSYDDPKSWTEDGIQFCNIDKAVEFYDFDDEAFFIDARNKEEYQEGHIPTAFFVDNYRADKMMPAIKDTLLTRPFLVVYCNGGDCEDSIYLATALSEEFDFDSELIYVFKEGMNEWTEHKLPVKDGEERGRHIPR